VKVKLEIGESVGASAFPPEIGDYVFGGQSDDGRHEAWIGRQRARKRRKTSHAMAGCEGSRTGVGLTPARLACLVSAVSPQTSFLACDISYFSVCVVGTFPA
jgi:hypothetical protein